MVAWLPRARRVRWRRGAGHGTLIACFLVALLADSVSGFVAGDCPSLDANPLSVSAGESWTCRSVSVAAFSTSTAAITVAEEPAIDEVLELVLVNGALSSAGLWSAARDPRSTVAIEIPGRSGSTRIPQTHWGEAGVQHRTVVQRDRVGVLAFLGASLDRPVAGVVTVRFNASDSTSSATVLVGARLLSRVARSGIAFGLAESPASSSAVFLPRGPILAPLPASGASVAVAASLVPGDVLRVALDGDFAREKFMLEELVLELSSSSHPALLAPSGNWTVLLSDFGRDGSRHWGPSLTATAAGRMDARWAPLEYLPDAGATSPTVLAIHVPTVASVSTWSGSFLVNLTVRIRSVVEFPAVISPNGTHLGPLRGVAVDTSQGARVLQWFADPWWWNVSVLVSSAVLGGAPLNSFAGLRVHVLKSDPRTRQSAFEVDDWVELSPQASAPTSGTREGVNPDWEADLAWMAATGRMREVGAVSEVARARWFIRLDWAVGDGRLATMDVDLALGPVEGECRSFLDCASADSAASHPSRRRSLDSANEDPLRFRRCGVVRTGPFGEFRPESRCFECSVDDDCPEGQFCQSGDDGVCEDASGSPLVCDVEAHRWLNLCRPKRQLGEPCSSPWPSIPSLQTNATEVATIDPARIQMAEWVRSADRVADGFCGDLRTWNASLVREGPALLSSLDALTFPRRLGAPEWGVARTVHWQGVCFAGECRECVSGAVSEGRGRRCLNGRMLNIIDIDFTPRTSNLSRITLSAEDASDLCATAPADNNGTNTRRDRRLTGPPLDVDLALALDVAPSTYRRSSVAFRVSSVAELDEANLEGMRIGDSPCVGIHVNRPLRLLTCELEGGRGVAQPVSLEDCTGERLLLLSSVPVVRFAAPVVASLDPSFGNTTGGFRMVIHGDEFGRNRNEVARVRVGSIDVPLLSHTPRRLEVQVPAGVGRALAVRVEMDGGLVSVGGPVFSFHPPSITRISPRVLRVDSVDPAPTLIVGRGFGPPGTVPSRVVLCPARSMTSTVALTSPECATCTRAEVASDESIVCWAWRFASSATFVAHVVVEIGDQTSSPFSDTRVAVLASTSASFPACADPLFLSAGLEVAPPADWTPPFPFCAGQCPAGWLLLGTATTEACPRLGFECWRGTRAVCVDLRSIGIELAAPSVCGTAAGFQWVHRAEEALPPVPILRALVAGATLGLVPGATWSALDGVLLSSEQAAVLQQLAASYLPEVVSVIVTAATPGGGLDTVLNETVPRSETERWVAEVPRASFVSVTVRAGPGVEATSPAVFVQGDAPCSIMQVRSVGTLVTATPIEAATRALLPAAPVTIRNGSRVVVSTEAPSFEFAVSLPIDPAPGEVVLIECEAASDGVGTVRPPLQRIGRDTPAREVSFTATLDPWDGSNDVAVRRTTSIVCRGGSRLAADGADDTLRRFSFLVPTVFTLAGFNELWPLIQDVLVLHNNSARGNDTVAQWVSAWTGDSSSIPTFADAADPVLGVVRGPSARGTGSFAPTVSGAIPLVLVCDGRWWLTGGGPCFSSSVLVTVGGLMASVLAVSSDGRFLAVLPPTFAQMCPSPADCAGRRGLKAIEVHNSVRFLLPANADAASDSPTTEDTTFPAPVGPRSSIQWVSPALPSSLASDNATVDSLRTVPATALSPFESLGGRIRCPPACPGLGSVDRPPAGSIAVLDSLTVGGSGGGSGLLYTEQCVGYPTSPTVCLDAATAGQCAFGSGDSCRPCPRGALCPGGSRVWPLPGFWVASEFSSSVEQCPAPSLERCLGWVSGVSLCGPGYAQGSYACITCASGYFPEIDGECRICPTVSSNTAVVDALLPLVSMLAFLGFLNAAMVYLATRRRGLGWKQSLKRSMEFLRWAVLILQLVSQSANATTPGIPAFVLFVNRMVSTALLDTTRAIHPDCLFYPALTNEILAIYGTLLLVLVFVIGTWRFGSQAMVHAVTGSTRRESVLTLAGVQGKLVSIGSLILLLIPFVTTNAMRLFDCTSEAGSADDEGDSSSGLAPAGVLVLRSNSFVRCFEGPHLMASIGAGIFLGGVALGFPLVAAVRSFKILRALRPPPRNIASGASPVDDAVSGDARWRDQAYQRSPSVWVELMAQGEYRPSAVYVRAVEVALAVLLSASTSFWANPATFEQSLLRPSLISVAFLGVFLLFLRASPYTAPNLWKFPVKVTSILIACNSAWLSSVLYIVSEFQRSSRAWELAGDVLGFAAFVETVVLLVVLLGAFYLSILVDPNATWYKELQSKMQTKMRRLSMAAARIARRSVGGTSPPGTPVTVSPSADGSDDAGAAAESEPRITWSDLMSVAVQGVRESLPRCRCQCGAQLDRCTTSIRCRRRGAPGVVTRGTPVTPSASSRSTIEPKTRPGLARPDLSARESTDTIQMDNPLNANRFRRTTLLTPADLTKSTAAFGREDRARSTAGPASSSSSSESSASAAESATAASGRARASLVSESRLRPSGSSHEGEDLLRPQTARRSVARPLTHSSGSVASQGATSTVHGRGGGRTDAMSSDSATFTMLSNPLARSLPTRPATLSAPSPPDAVVEGSASVFFANPMARVSGRPLPAGLADARAARAPADASESAKSTSTDSSAGPSVVTDILASNPMFRPSGRERAVAALVGTPPGAAGGGARTDTPSASSASASDAPALMSNPMLRRAGEDQGRGRGTRKP